MLVRINGTTVVDPQEQLFQDVKESFIRLIEEHRRKHWFKEFMYGFTGGEELIDMDRIKAKLWYWKLIIVLRSLRLFIQVVPPDEETSERLIEVLTRLRDRLEVD